MARIRSLTRAALAAYAALVAAQAAAAAETPPPAATNAPLASVLITDVPHVVQRTDFCGEACAEMFLRKLGSRLTQDDVFNAGKVDPLQARGCYTRELAPALAAVGFKVGPVGFEVEAARAAAGLEKLYAGLHADLAKGVPSIVCMRTGTGPTATEHFRLMLGYDAAHDDVVYHEPAFAPGAYRKMPRRQFLDLWPLKYQPDRWTVIRFRLEPAHVNTNAVPAKGLTNADYAQHMMELRKKIPSRDFAVTIERPFVVLGDEGRATVQRRAEQTVRWAVQRLKATYFEREPAHIIDIWLFKDKESYDRHTRSIFHDTPTTPFGYSSTEHKALIMNIATGGGTLVHEMVHPFMAADFPACPSWFNEGLASLYEQSDGEGARIRGLTNWRLAGLQDAIREKRLDTFDALTHTTQQAFYTDPGGTHYAQARYLCYYLQERDLLPTYYRRFKAAAATDPSGYGTLQAVLGEKDMAAFQKRWEQFVLGLRFP